MKIISVINYKGGVGKTTLTANLAAELAWRGHRVLMVDLDPQASLTFAFVQPDRWRAELADEKTIKTWYDALDRGLDVKLRELVFRPERAARALNGNGQLDLIPSHLGLINVDLELATLLAGATLTQAKRNFIRVHRRLAVGLATVVDEYDVVLIDCPPNFNIVTKTAIVASDGVLIPAKPDYLSTLGIDYLHSSVKQLVHDFNEYAQLDDAVATIGPEVSGVVFTMVQYYAGEPISALRPYIRQTKDLKLPVLKEMVRENKTLFSSAAETGVPVILSRHSNKVHDNVVDEFERVVTELLPRIL